MSNFKKDMKYIYDNWNSPTRRPIWEILLLLPLYLLYLPCKVYVEWFEK